MPTAKNPLRTLLKRIRSLAASSRDFRKRNQPFRARQSVLGCYIERLEPRTLLAATELPNDSQTLFLSHFNDSLVGASAEMPTASGGISFPLGIIDKGAKIGPEGFLQYPIPDNIATNSGTIEYWIRPDWNPDGTTRTFFQVGDNFNNGILLAIDGANNIRFIQWGDDPETPAIESSVERGVGVSGSDWQSGVWRHFAVTWHNPTREIAMYLDGRLVASASNSITIPAFSGSSFTIGARNDGSLSANATFDEFRISGTRRSAGEILDDYYAGLGIENLLNDPQGITVDSQDRTIVAEAGRNRITFFAPNGSKLLSVGGSGTGNAQFNQPNDVHVGAANEIFVVDTGNHRVQTLNSDGTFSSQFGAFGTAPDQFNQPKGIYYDPILDRVYVADTLNHRVQRFTTSGQIDTIWGSGGVVGLTGVVRHDHGGFNMPTDIAVNPITGEVYVADYGNQRLEVFNRNGVYQRSYLAVYRANRLAFDSSGNLYIAGEDPNDGYTAMDGRLRLLKMGDTFISRNYTGGIDDIGRIETGVAIRNDGSIVFSDNLNARIVRTQSNFSEPVTDLSVDANGTSVTIQWRSAIAGPSVVTYKNELGVASTVTNATVTNDHSITLTGMTPNTVISYQIGFTDTFDGQLRFTAPDLVNTGSLIGSAQFLRLKAVGAIYTDTNPDVGITKQSPSEILAARERFREVADFYWRNSGFKLWLDIQIVEIDNDITSSNIDFFSRFETDLAALGFSVADQIDAVWGSSVLAAGNFGGGGTLFGRFVAMAEWVSQDDFVAVHEVNHTIDSMYHHSGLQKYEFNHGIWAVPNGSGGDFAVNGQILRNMLPANFTAVREPFSKVMTAPDIDDDGLPDSSPAGLTNPLTITEATLGSSNSLPDSDLDGLSDRVEAMALTAAATNLLSNDSDDDGNQDAVDLNPLFKMNDRVVKGSPSINGVIEASDGWTVLTNRWGFSNTTLVNDNNLFQADTTTYAAWDEGGLYLALKGPGSITDVTLDGNLDNIFAGAANYFLSIGNSSDFLSAKVNVGVPDLFRQIDDSGEFSMFFDSDPQFVKPYLGRRFFDKPHEGAGFPSRLITEQDLTYSRSGFGDDQVWEVRIPWSTSTQLMGHAGKKLGLTFDVGGDRLFSTDDSATIELVNNIPTDVLLSKSSIAENAGPNAVVGLLAGVAPNTGSGFSFSLPAGLGNNDRFNLNGNALRANSSFNFESVQSYSVTVRASIDGASIDKQFTIRVTNVNEAPTNITLSNSSVLENAGANAAVGSLAGIDPDQGDTLSFSLPTGLGNNNLFRISGNALRAFSSLDFETLPRPTVFVRVADRNGLAFTKSFLISVINQNETPTLSGPASRTVAGNTPVTFSSASGTAITASDVDAGSAQVRLSVTATNGLVTLPSTSGLTFISGANGQPSFTVNGTLANLNAALNGLRYMPTLNFSGNTTINFVLNDLGNSGLGGAKSIAKAIALTVNSPVFIVDNVDSGYSETGVWSGSSISGYNGTTTRFASGTGIAATWRAPSLTPGYYSVSIWKVAFASNSTNAQVTIVHNGISEPPKSVNLSTGTSGFVNLGTFYFSGAPSELVRLSQGASLGILRADAVRFIRQPVNNAAPTITAPASRTIAGNTPFSFSSATGSAITLRDVDAGLAQVRLSVTATNGSVTLPSTSGLTFISGANGQSSFTVNGTLANLNAALNGLRYMPTLNFSGNASINLVLNDLGNTGLGGAKSVAKTIALTVNSPVFIVDNLDAGYSETGIWSGSSISGYNGTTTRFASGAGIAATWRAPSLAPGFYSVSIWKVASASNSTNAQVTIVHNGISEPPKSINLSTGASGFVNLGTFFFSGAPNELVQLSQGTSLGLLRADAVRFIKQP